ncbi:MAG: aromatic amino acid transport family protein [bacterium]
MKYHGYYQAVAILMGAILGVGIFGLPYVGLHAGLIPMIGFFLLAIFLLYTISYIYGQVIIGTNEKHRLPGYVEKYLGHNWKSAAFMVTVIGVWGALLSYLLIGGSFLGEIFIPLIGGSELFYVLTFFFIGVFFIYRDAKTIARTEIILLALFAIIVILFVMLGIDKVDLKNIQLFDKSNFIIVYGVSIFALWGVNVIPDILEINTNNKKILKNIIITSLTISSLLYVVYTLIIIGVAGKNTSIDSISGLSDYFGEKTLIVGYLFGIIATFTSFIAMGLNLKKVFMFDYYYHRIPALILATCVPMALYLGGIRNYIEVIAVIGGSVLAVESIVILRLYEKFVDERTNLINDSEYRIRAWTKPLMVLFGLGAVIGIITPFLLSRL